MSLMIGARSVTHQGRKYKDHQIGMRKHPKLLANSATDAIAIQQGSSSTEDIATQQTQH